MGVLDGQATIVTGVATDRGRGTAPQGGVPKRPVNLLDGDCRDMRRER